MCFEIVKTIGAFFIAHNIHCAGKINKNQAPKPNDLFGIFGFSTDFIIWNCLI